MAVSRRTGDTRELDYDADALLDGSSSAKPIHGLVATDFFDLHRPSRCT